MSPRSAPRAATSAPAGGVPPRLGIRANAAQYTLLILVSVFVGGMVGLERAILPLLAEREFAIASRAAVLSFIVGFGLAKALANLAAGVAADRFGRRPVLITGWLLGLPVPVLIIAAPDWSWVVAANLLLGVQQGLCWSTTVIMKIDLAGPARRGLAMGLNEATSYLAVSLAALASGYLAAAYAPRPHPFYLGVAFAVLGLLLSIVAVRETQGHARLESGAWDGPGADGPASGTTPERAPGPVPPVPHAPAGPPGPREAAMGAPALSRAGSSLRSSAPAEPPAIVPGGAARALPALSFGRLLLVASWRDRTLFSASQAGFVNNLNDGMAWGLFPLLFAAAGLDLATIGALAALYPGVWGVLQFATGPLSDRVGRKRPIVLGMWLQALALALVVLWRGVAPWALAMGLLGVGTALVYPTLIGAVSDVTHPAGRARAVGVYRLWRDLGYAVGALAAGALADRLGMSWAVAAVAALTFASGVGVAAVMRETLPSAGRPGPGGPGAGGGT